VLASVLGFSMLSRMPFILSILIRALLLVDGCTEKLPVEPVYTDDTNWTPLIELAHNGYQRFEIYVSRPPRQELLRNLLFHTVEVRSGPSTDFVTVDTFNSAMIVPAYVYGGTYPAAYYPFPYVSKPILSNDTSYTVRLKTFYRTGASMVSNGVSFVSSAERGNVIRRLPMPQMQPYDYSSMDLIAFHGGELLVLRDQQLFGVDTSTAQATLIKDDFTPPTGAPDWLFRNLSASGDTVFTFYSDPWGQQFTLVSLDLNTLRVDSSLKVSMPGKQLAAVIGEGALLRTLWEASGLQQVIFLDRRNGQVVQTFPEVPIAVSVAYYGTGSALAFDGASLWFSSVNAFDNRLLRCDAATLAIEEQHRNPIFAPQGLVWDGANFWVIDQETRTIAKLQLEGM
jgi:hypothetical protein